METSRHYGMDWLRIGAFALLILYHVGMFFVPWDWHVKTAEPLNWTALPMLASNSWRLPLLFVVSGYATRMVLRRAGGSGAFAKERSARLLIPLLFAVVFIIPPQPWVELSFKHGYQADFAAFFINDYFRFGTLHDIVLPTWQHMWFVLYLWVYTMLLALMVSLLPRRVLEFILNTFARLLSRSMLIVLPVLWLASVRFLLFPGAEETHALFDDWSAHFRYLPMFLFGFLLAGAPNLWASIRNQWVFALIAAIFAYAIVAAIELAYPGDTPVPGQLAPVVGISRTIHGWCSVVALLGIADKYWDRDAPPRAKLTEAVFPFYIIHQTIIVVAGWYLLPLRLHPLAEFALLIAATSAGCWMFYEIGRRNSWLRPFVGLKR